MADHTIRMTIPSHELGGRDVSFEVFIDKEKRGELWVSEGGVDWWPKHAKKKRHTALWTALAKFLETLPPA